MEFYVIFTQWELHRGFGKMLFMMVACKTTNIVWHLLDDLKENVMFTESRKILTQGWYCDAKCVLTFWFMTKWHTELSV